MANSSLTRQGPAWFPALASFLLALLFIYAAASKLLDFGLFRGQLLNQDLPAGLARVLAYLLPALELLAVLLLAFRRTLLAGLLLSFLLLFFFTGYTGLVLFGYWDRVPCSCGGILNHMSWKAHFFFNLCFLALSLAALLRELRKEVAA